MLLYQIRNTVTGKKYYGISKSPKQRWYTHRYHYKHGMKTKFYDAVRKYGESAFVLEILDDGPDKIIAQKEIDIIASDPDCYNLHPGGHTGFDVSTKDSKSVEEWKAKLRKARKGKKPALGMRHTEETKKLCGEYGKLRWDIHGRYPADVLGYSFIEANKKFGISKTHYYRLRKAATR